VYVLGDWRLEVADERCEVGSVAVGGAVWQGWRRSRVRFPASEVKFDFFFFLFFRFGFLAVICVVSVFFFLSFSCIIFLYFYIFIFSFLHVFRFSDFHLFIFSKYIAPV
jgi:hypothetical protein